MSKEPKKELTQWQRWAFTLGLIGTAIVVAYEIFIVAGSLLFPNGRF